MAQTKQYGLETLSKEVAEQFEITDWTGSHRQFFGRFGIIDLSTLSVQQADRLVRLRFPRIRRKEVKKAEASEPAKSKK